MSQKNEEYFKQKENISNQENSNPEYNNFSSDKKKLEGKEREIKQNISKKNSLPIVSVDSNEIKNNDSNTKIKWWDKISNFFKEILEKEWFWVILISLPMIIWYSFYYIMRTAFWLAKKFLNFFFFLIRLV